MTGSDLSLVRGTVDLLVLKALSFGSSHGYAVAKWIRSVTGKELLVDRNS